MKHVLDRSQRPRPALGLRRFYAGQRAKRPTLAILQLQKRAKHERIGVSGIHHFLRIERENGA